MADTIRVRCEPGLDKRELARLYHFNRIHIIIFGSTSVSKEVGCNLAANRDDLKSHKFIHSVRTLMQDPQNGSEE